ncbi:hypothetical protein EDD16DRAFT_1522357 [Pisolithus croceorrhizus]|nr:hypothetical protein EDD16DRAFT_1522357 [Pisolithus croceorrhizus]KAI6119640.1 hypothetical protein EV401DRAFT_1888113 [Pisolithus croceorrhizus]
MVEEEAALLGFLYSHLGQVADGNLKKVMWNATTVHMARNFSPSKNAGNKTAEACEQKFKMLKKYYYAVTDLNDKSGAMITLENVDLWDHYVKHVCTANDTVKGELLSSEEHYAS